MLGWSLDQGSSLVLNGIHSFLGWIGDARVGFEPALPGVQTAPYLSAWVC